MSNRVHLRLAPDVQHHGRSGETVERVLVRGRQLIAAHGSFLHAEDEDSELVITVHHREASAILRHPNQLGSVGMWRVKYDAVVPGSAAKQFGEWLAIVLREASAVVANDQ